MACIAVVDDDPGFMDLADELFRDRGWEVVTCNEARVAVECVTEARPDVVLLDVRMDSGHSGWDILDALKAEPATASIPVIVCSAAADELRTHESRMGESGVIVRPKPFDIDDLYQDVEAALALAAEWSGKPG